MAIFEKDGRTVETDEATPPAFVVKLRYRGWREVPAATEPAPRARRTRETPETDETEELPGGTTDDQ